MIVLGDRVRAAAFAFKREFIPIALASSPAATIVKIGVLPARLKDALVAAIKAADTNQLPWAAMARSLGVIYFALLPARSQRSVPSSSSCYNESHFGCRRIVWREYDDSLVSLGMEIRAQNLGTGTPRSGTDAEGEKSFRPARHLQSRPIHRRHLESWPRPHRKLTKKRNANSL